MEIIFVSEKALRLKSKTATFGIFGRDEKEKTVLDAIFSFGQATLDGETVIFTGPGEYEVKGVKITGEGKDILRGFSGRIENMQVFIGQASTLGDPKDLPEADVAIIRADVSMELKPIANLGAHLVVLSGPEALKIAQQLQPDIQEVSKVAIIKDKLAEDMQVVVLG